METTLKPSRLEYWNLPGILQESINQEQVNFLKAFKDKIEGIQYAYSKPLNEKQVAFIKKDEALIEATENFINFLGDKIEYLLREHKTLNEMLSVAYQEKTDLENQVLSLIKENSLIRLKYKTI